MKIAFLTLGCKVNSYETEKMKQQFETAGHQIVSFTETADVYVVNTCTVTNIADRKSRKMLHRARRRNPAAIVVAAGCYVDSARQKGETDASVDVFVSNREKEDMVLLLEKIWRERTNGTGELSDRAEPEHCTAELSGEELAERHAGELSGEELAERYAGELSDRTEPERHAGGLSGEELPERHAGELSGEELAEHYAGELSDRTEPERHAGGLSEKAEQEQHTRAYIKVQNGCNQYCTYCIIPYVRGELASRPDEEILREVEELARRGFREVVVTGIHLSSFGVDRLEEKPDAGSFLKLEGRPLLELLEKIAAIDGIARIRLGSLEPRIITGEFVRKLSGIRKVCPHFHLSLQSGCDATLRRMNRHYTVEEYLEKVELLRKYYEHPAITTDIITGFPQESEEEFAATCQFARRVGFAQIHVFKYSRRQGTVADGMEGQISEQTKKSRSEQLLEVERFLEQQYQQYFMNRREKVLWEEVVTLPGGLYLVGYNERYVRIAAAVEDRERAEQLCNQWMEVTVTDRLTDEILTGRIGKHL